MLQALPGNAEGRQQQSRRRIGGDAMFRKVIISGLMGLVGLGALAAGAQATVTLVVLGSLVLLGWIGLNRRQ